MKIIFSEPKVILANRAKLLILFAKTFFILWKRFTDSIKINRPGHSIRMYWPNVWQPTVHAQQNIFEKTLMEAGSSHFYASFGTFCVQIGQFFVPQWVFKHSEEFRNRRHFPSKTTIYRCSSNLQKLTVTRKIDQFGRKRCQKKRKDLS